MKTYLGFPWPQGKVDEILASLRHRLESLDEIRIIRIDYQDQMPSNHWIYPLANKLITSAMRHTSARLVIGHEVVREKTAYTAESFRVFTT